MQEVGCFCPPQVTEKVENTSRRTLPWLSPSHVIKMTSAFWIKSVEVLKQNIIQKPLSAFIWLWLKCCDRPTCALHTLFVHFNISNSWAVCASSLIHLHVSYFPSPNSHLLVRTILPLPPTLCVYAYEWVIACAFVFQCPLRLLKWLSNTKTVVQKSVYTIACVLCNLQRTESVCDRRSYYHIMWSCFQWYCKITFQWCQFLKLKLLFPFIHLFFSHRFSFPIHLFHCFQISYLRFSSVLNFSVLL